jgi:hypothetical protein
MLATMSVKDVQHIVRCVSMQQSATNAHRDTISMSVPMNVKDVQHIALYAITKQNVMSVLTGII